MIVHGTHYHPYGVFPSLRFNPVLLPSGTPLKFTLGVQFSLVNYRFGGCVGTKRKSELRENITGINGQSQLLHE